MDISKLDNSALIVVSKEDLMEALEEIVGNGNNAKNPEFGDRFISIDEVATITGYKRPTLYRFVALKQIPHYKRKGRISFKSSEIQEWMRQGKCDA